MNLWVAFGSSHRRRQPLETLLRPVDFPHFQDRPNELRSERVNRWRAEYKELSERQHQFLLAVVCYAVSEARGIPSLEQALQTWADHFMAYRDLDMFHFQCTIPLEVGVQYRLSGSSRTHHLSVSIKSPSEELK